MSCLIWKHWTFIPHFNIWKYFYLMFRKVSIKTYFLDYEMKINYRTCDISWYIEWYAQKSDQTFSCMHQNSGTTYRLHSSDIGYLTLLMMSLSLQYAKLNWIFPIHIRLTDSIIILRNIILFYVNFMSFISCYCKHQSGLNCFCHFNSEHCLQCGKHFQQYAIWHIYFYRFLCLFVVVHFCEEKNKIFNETNRLFIPALWNTFTPAHILGSLLSLFMIWSLYTKSVHKIKLTMLIRVDTYLFIGKRKEIGREDMLYNSTDIQILEKTLI